MRTATAACAGIFVLSLCAPVHPQVVPQVYGLADAVWSICRELDVHTVDVRFAQTSRELAGAIDETLKELEDQEDGEEIRRIVYQEAAKPIIDRLGGQATEYWRDFFQDLGVELRQRNFDPSIGAQMRLAYTEVARGLRMAGANRDAFLENATSTLEKTGYTVVAPGDYAARREADTKYYLTFAVYAVLVVLLLLFLLVSVVRNEQTQMLIRSRTFFEIASLAFLMVTLLILGMSDKIDVETLGPLLGTIAGYLFGRQMAGQQPS